MSAYKKLALTAGITAALAGASFSSHAIIEGAAGEALLVPFVLYDQPHPLLNPDGVWINTLVEVTTPGAVGFDTVPNFFTAPNTTPTNLNGSLATDPDLGAVGAYTAALHWYFFSDESEELANDTIPTSPDDFTLINWGDIVFDTNRDLMGVKGYLVITNDKEDFDTGWRGPAKFTMFGDAYTVWPVGFGLIDSKIPVLPMSDGADTAGEAVTVRNQVIFDEDGSVIDASPLAAGMRIGRSDGVPGDYTLFDLTMSNRFLPTLHVIWVDENIGQSKTAFVYNDLEQRCSKNVPIAKELQVYWTSPTLIHPANFLPPIPAVCTDQDPNNDPADPRVCNRLVPPMDWIDAAVELCYPGGAIGLGFPEIITESNILYPGFVRFRIDEYLDTNINNPEASAVAFSIQLQVDVINNTRDELVFPPQILPIETALGHERATFSLTQ